MKKLVLCALLTLGAPVFASEVCEFPLMPADTLARYEAELGASDIANYNDGYNTLLHPPHQYTCYVQDRYRRRYAATAPTPPAAENRARLECERITGWPCYELGCRQGGRRGD